MRKKHAWTILLVAVLAVPFARGDGGRVQMHQAAGPFVVTLFSIPDDLVTGPADLSVGVEDAATGELVNDAQVQFTLAKLDGDSTNRILAMAIQGAVGNGILKSAEINIPSAGQWHITVAVSQGAKQGICSMDLTVGTAHSQAYTLWAATLCPPLLIALFLVHQRRKRQWSLERTIRSASV